MRLSAQGFVLAVAAFLVASLLVIAYYAYAAAAEDARGRTMSVPVGDVRQGRAAIAAHGCASCHRIAGVRLPGGRVGPSLVGIPQRQFLAGELANTPANLVHWIMAPQAVRPGSAMPNLGVTREEAQDITAYLYATGDQR